MSGSLTILPEATNGIPEAARWKGPPDNERIQFLRRNYFYDQDNHWGGGHGVMYRRIGTNWMKVRYGKDGKELGWS